jgi:RsiW-degrading membrane proteinase PrsW (M82 family)
MTLITVIALVIASAIPMSTLYLIHRLDFFKTGTFVLVVACFGYGWLAYGLAAWANTQTIQLGWVDYTGMVRFVAPVVEEILKSLILVILVRRKSFTYFIDGAIYGFGVGIGFAVFENFEYILGNPQSALVNAISRVISTNLMHAAATAVIGIILGVSRGYRLPARAGAWIAGILLPIAIHLGYNNLVTRVDSGWLQLLYAVIAGGGAAGFITWFIKLGLKQEKESIAVQLGDSSERVEKGEVAAIQKLDDLDALVVPLESRFGKAKADQIKELLRLQARIGILKRDIEKFTDFKMRTAVQSQIDEFRQQMENQRKGIGPYAMLFLRGTYLETDGSLYERLERAIAERIKSQGSGGTNIYETLGKKIVPTKQNTGG